MALGSIKFHPSVIEDEIYNVLDSDPDFLYSSDEYTASAVEAVMNYFTQKRGETLQWSLADDMWPDCTGGQISICWIEGGFLHHMGFAYHF